MQKSIVVFYLDSYSGPVRSVWLNYVTLPRTNDSSDCLVLVVKCSGYLTPNIAVRRYFEWTVSTLQSFAALANLK